jgi:acyl carrier protein
MPATCVVLETMVAEKIDCLALPEFERQIERYLPSLTPCEEMAAVVWSDVLDMKAVARHESFFELGGHSLLATRVVSQLRSRFGVEIPLRVVFDNPTLGELGRFIANWQEDASNESEPREDILREEALL